MKLLYIGVFYVSMLSPVFGQPLASFQTLPYERQLYARDGTSRATVLIEGSVTDPAIVRVACFMTRAGKPDQQQRVTISDTRTFRFDPTIRAERAEYGVSLYAYRATGDSVLLAERKRLLCGDVFVIYGQSNAIGLGGLDQSSINDQYMRQCGYAYGATDIPSAMQWYPANQPYGAVGAFGLYMAEAIMAVTNIPICLINGAEGGASANQLNDRNANSPTDLTTFYGRMLYRTRWAGYQGQVKAIFFKQGEAEAGSSALGYQSSFDRLYQNLRKDYGTAPRMYVSQINIMARGQDNAGELRDFQRRLKQIYPSGLENIATVGTQGYDGIHYSLEGNAQIAREQARQVLRDLYGQADTIQVNSPNVRKVIQNSQHDTLTLVFEPEMQLVWTADSVQDHGNGRYARLLADVFYPDNQTGRISTGRAVGNRVQLVLRQPGPVQTLTYLPPFFSDAKNGFYDGPVLKNTRGMRAFSFDKVAVVRALPAITNLSLLSNTATREISLSWTGSTTAATEVVLERATAGVTPFVPIATLPASSTTYREKPPASALGQYQYRLRLVSPVSESELSNVVAGQLPVICSLSVSLGSSSTLAIGATASISATVTGALPATDGVLLRWAGEGVAGNQTNPLAISGLLPSSTNVYTVTAMQGVCSATATTTVTVQTPCALSVAIAGAQLIPFGETLSLSAVVTGTQLGMGPLTARWSGPAGYTATGTTLTQTALTPNLSGPYSLTVEQGRCLATATAAVVIEQPLAMETPADTIRVGPNPLRVGQPLWLLLPRGTATTPLQLTIWTLTGQRVLTSTVLPTTQTELPTASLRPGLYLLNIASTTHLLWQRLLVE
ncbi:sialate O-acetylesterase [Fibrella aquatilis]|uniref:Sialate O-acetylesterase domain-containing protein n=1 Tax=Fibrella aquatilis TaxID=2817059 RepID=A0A939G7R1_9BACT|nr:sialate O-acetylesterase [Fibrella aquatilis]MBO0933754.1 hypothetical protein [Fibrella aquatilis]